MEATGQNESYALLQILAAPPFDGLGNHAIAFAGEVDISPGTSVWDAVRDLKDALDDEDNQFVWDLDITTGPDWRQVKTAAPLVVVTDVSSTGTDSDDQFQFGIHFRSPRWTVRGAAGLERIVLTFQLSRREKSFGSTVWDTVSRQLAPCAIQPGLSRKEQTGTKSPTSATVRPEEDWGR